MEKKQIMPVEKFLQEIRELYLANSKTTKYQTSHRMSPMVILRRLTPKAIEQHTGQHKQRIRNLSLSEGEDSVESSYSTEDEDDEDDDEDEDECVTTQSTDALPFDIQHNLTVESSVNKKVYRPSETAVALTEDAQNMESDIDGNVDDVMNSDYSGEFPDLTDPSWESPSKEGSNTKSPKKQLKKKRKLGEENKKRGDAKLMKSARKAFEYQRKMFRANKDMKTINKGGQANIMQSELPINNAKSPEHVLQGIQQSSTFSGKNIAFFEKLRRNMLRTIQKDSLIGFKLTGDPNLPVSSGPPLISSAMHMEKDEVLLPTLEAASSNNPNLIALSSDANVNTGGTNCGNIEGDLNNSYDSDQTVAFEESQSQYTSPLQNNNTEIIRKRKRSESKEKEISVGKIERNKAKRKSQDRPQVSALQMPVETVPSTFASILPVPTVRQGANEMGSGMDTVISLRTDRVLQERETSSVGEKNKPKETNYEGSALLLAQEISKGSHVEDGKENRSSCALPVEAASVTKSDDEKRSELIEKETLELIGSCSSNLSELQHKKMKCEEKIESLKTEFNRRISLLEAERKHYDKEIDKTTAMLSSCYASLKSSSGNSAANRVASLASPEDKDLLKMKQPSSVMLNVSRDPSHDVSLSLAREIPVFNTIASGNNSESAKHIAELSNLQQNSVINIISEANINHFGNSSSSAPKKRAKKSMSKPKSSVTAVAAASGAAVTTATTATVVTTVTASGTTASNSGIILQSMPVSSNRPGRPKKLDINTRDTASVSFSGMVLQPQNQPPIQVQSSSATIWPSGTITAQPVSSLAPVAPSLVVTNVIQPQQQVFGLCAIQSVNPRKSPPSYSEHQLRAAGLPHNQGVDFIKQANASRLRMVSAGNQPQQLQVITTQSNQHDIPVSLQQQPQSQQVTVQLQAQQTDNPALKQFMQQNHMQQLLLHQQKPVQQHSNTTRQGGKKWCSAFLRCPLSDGSLEPNLLSTSVPVSKAGHQSHLLVNTIPVPTSGAAMARFAHAAQSPSSVVSRLSKHGDQPQTANILALRMQPQSQLASNHPKTSLLLPAEPTLTSSWSPRFPCAGHLHQDLRISTSVCYTISILQPFLFVLLHLFNLIWERGVLPQHWKSAIVLPFHKRGASGLDTSHYHPIALTSVVCKVMERLVNIRLMWFLETYNSLFPRQYSFRKAAIL
ncbi:uncharacterized protein [Cherax quadricarinatus]|uniref:uncharacterized protein isoform X2 n=1 Tax=Cherax quadricarinatus TaxID=27406 RepID=UPI00387EE131